MTTTHACYGNWDKLWPDGPLGLYADTAITSKERGRAVILPATQHNTRIWTGGYESIVH